MFVPVNGNGEKFGSPKFPNFNPQELEKFKNKTNLCGEILHINSGTEFERVEYIDEKMARDSMFGETTIFDQQLSNDSMLGNTTIVDEQLTKDSMLGNTTEIYKNSIDKKSEGLSMPSVRVKNNGNNFTEPYLDLKTNSEKVENSFTVTANHIDILLENAIDGKIDFSIFGNYFFILATETNYRKALLANIELAIADYEYECLKTDENLSNQKQIQNSLEIAVKHLQILVNSINNPTV